VRVGRPRRSACAALTSAHGLIRGDVPWRSAPFHSFSLGSLSDSQCKNWRRRRIGSGQVSLRVLSRHSLGFSLALPNALLINREAQASSILREQHQQRERTVAALLVLEKALRRNAEALAQMNLPELHHDMSVLFATLADLKWVSDALLETYTGAAAAMMGASDVRDDLRKYINAVSGNAIAETVRLLEWISKVHPAEPKATSLLHRLDQAVRRLSEFDTRS
jgi:hypothetical protein